MKPILFPLIVLILLSGCVSTNSLNQSIMPAHIAETTSVYDGAREVSLTPAFTYTESGLYLGLYWRSPMKDQVVLVAEVNGFENFDPNASIKFKIDGKETILAPATTSDFGGLDIVDFGISSLKKSRKSYKTDKQFIAKLINSQNTVVRVELLKGYAEGRFTLTEDETVKLKGKGAERMAQPAFAKFYNEVWRK